VDIREEPIHGIEAKGLRYGKDKLLEVDAIVFATGFDAMTGALLNMNIVGRGGRPLRDVWEHGARTYLGLTTVGFPNLFMVTGPGSPSVLSNMVMSIEDHVDWISDCVAFMEREGVASIEPTEHLQQAWMEEVGAIETRRSTPAATAGTRAPTSRASRAPLPRTSASPITARRSRRSRGTAMRRSSWAATPSPRDPVARANPGNPQ
jgi:cyclohexanone monooxygenase